MTPICNLCNVVALLLAIFTAPRTNKIQISGSGVKHVAPKNREGYMKHNDFTTSYKLYDNFRLYSDIYDV
jgi:hypothetical protein